MTIKKTDQELKNFYIDCLVHKREDRKNLAQQHGIPYSKASTAYYLGCEILYKDIERANNELIECNIGKGAL